MLEDRFRKREKEEIKRQLRMEVVKELREQVINPLEEDKRTLLNNLKIRLWEQYRANEDAVFRMELLRRLFSDEGGVIYYCQSFMGLINGMTVDSDLDRSKEVVINRFICNLRNRIQVAFPLNENGIDVSYNFRCAMDQTAYVRHIESMNGIDCQKWIAFAEARGKEWYQNQSNSFYYSLLTACLGLLNYFTIDFEQDTNNCDSMQELLTLLNTQRILLKYTFSYQGIEFIDYADSLSESIKEDCFLTFGQSQLLPAVVRKEDNYLYFKGSVNL